MLLHHCFFLADFAFSVLQNASALLLPPFHVFSSMSVACISPNSHTHSVLSAFPSVCFFIHSHCFSSSPYRVLCFCRGEGALSADSVWASGQWGLLVPKIVLLQSITNCCCCFHCCFFSCKSAGAAGDLCVAVSEFDSQIQELFGHQDSDLPCCSRCFWALWSPHLTEYTEVLLQTSVTFCSYNFQALHYPQLSSFSLNWGLH